jgi:DNA-binding SARP family transcriptional activator
MLKLYFLGEPHFQRDRELIRLTSAKAVALLAYLAVTAKPQARDHLLSLLWAESASEAARKNLRNTLWALRKAFGENIIAAENDRIGLSEDAWIDVREFEHGGLDCYTGQFLDGLSLAEAPDFELWMDSERERLIVQYTRLIMAQIAAARQAGDPRSMLDLAQRGIAAEPANEQLFRVLMEAHARLGDRAAAQHDYNSLDEALQRELGIRPLPETDALLAAILKGAFQQDMPTESKPRPVRIERVSSPFIGRKTELAKLEEMWQSTSLSHTGQVILLTGEMGIGKSRLWREWAGMHPEATILESRCLEMTETLPFAPIVELFKRMPALRALLGAGSPVAPFWLAELERLFPEIHAAHANLPTHPVLPADEERQHVFEALTQCLQVLLESAPVALFLDDIHWADHATLDWLGYVVNRLHDTPLLLALAYRSEDAAAALAHLVANWAREGILRRVPLERLRIEDTMMLISALGGDPTLAHYTEQSAGNPYFLIELVRAPSPQQIPAALADILRARLDRLPETARGVLSAAVVLQSDFDFYDLRDLSGLSEEDALDGVDTLIAAAVLIEQPGGIAYNFAHPLVATVIQEDMSETRRVLLNRRAATMIEDRHHDQLQQVAGRLSRHYELANDPAKAAAYAEFAALHALSLAASTEAANFYRKAIALEPTAARYFGLGDALVRQGENMVAAREAYQAALDSYLISDGRCGAARSSLAIADTYLPSGRIDEASAWVKRSLNYLQNENDPATLAMAHFILGAGGAMTDANLSAAEGHLREAGRLANEYGLADMLARSRFELGNLLAQRGAFRDALTMFGESIAAARKMDNEFLEVLGYNNYAYHALLANDLAAARQYAAKGLALAREHALRIPLQYLYSTHGEIALAEGRWAEAEEWFHKGLVEAEYQHNNKQRANYYANLGLAAKGRGDLDEALVLLEKAQTQVINLESPAPHLYIQIALWLTELYLAREELSAALDSLVNAEREIAQGDRAGLSDWAARLRKTIAANRQR